MAAATTGIRTVLPRGLSASHLDGSAVRELVHSIDTFVFDCDGVLWRGEELVPGTAEALAALRRAGKRLLFVTNNGAKSRAGAAAKFEALGVPRGLVPAGDVVTGAYSAARYLAARPEFAAPAAGRRPVALFLGAHEGLGAELADAGIEAVCAAEGAEQGPGQPMTAARFAALPGQLALPPGAFVAAVVAGVDVTLTFAKVARAALALQDPRCLFVATNLDTNIPIMSTSGGGGGGGGERMKLMMPEAGATVGALRGGTGREPVDCGKGGDWIVELMASEFGIGGGGGGGGGGALRVAMVGDNMRTDMAFGRQCGFVNMLPLTGVTTEQALAPVLRGEGGGDGDDSSDSGGAMTAPHFVIDSVACLAQHLL